MEITSNPKPKNLKKFLFLAIKERLNNKMTPEFVMVAMIIELVLLVVEFIIFFSPNNCKKDLTNHSKCAIIYTERKKGTAKPLGKIKMFWINVTRKEQTTDEAKVAEWVKNGDDIDVYTWCNPCGCYVQAKFN